MQTFFWAEAEADWPGMAGILSWHNSHLKHHLYKISISAMGTFQTSSLSSGLVGMDIRPSIKKNFAQMF